MSEEQSDEGGTLGTILIPSCFVIGGWMFLCLMKILNKNRERHDQTSRDNNLSEKDIDDSIVIKVRSNNVE